MEALSGVARAAQDRMRKLRTPAPGELKYAAFISYSHKDKTYREPDADAREAGFPLWLHRRLENFRVPAPLRRDYASLGKALPERLGRVFRDDDELGSEKDLGTAIERALRRSENIVVLCSPRSAASKYVADEVRAFKHLRNGDNVFAVIIEGKPEDPQQECFSDALKFEVDEQGGVTDQPARRNPIAADLQEFDRETVFLKLVAGLLNIDFGRLRDREKQAERRRRARARMIFATGVTLVVLALAGAFGVARLISGIGQRTSMTLAELARAASDASDFERAARFARAGLTGADLPVVGFEADAAEAELRRALLGSRRLNTLEGHRDRVTWAGFSANGDVVLTTSWDGDLRLWSADTGELMRTLDGGVVDGDVRHAAFSPDGASIAAAFGGDARILDSSNLETRRRLQGHLLTLRELAFSADGARLGGIIGNQSLIVWDVASGRELAWIRPDRDRVAAFALSPDGARVAAAMESGAVRIFDTNGGRLVRELGDADWPAEAIAFAPGGESLAAGWQNGEVRIWTTATGEMQASLDLDASISSIAFAPGGDELAIGAEDGAIVVVDLEYGASREYSGHEDAVVLAYSPDGSQLASASEDGTARLWRTGDDRDQRPVAVLRGHGGAVSSVSFSPDGRRVVTASDDRTARVWRTGEGLERTFDDSVLSAAFSPDGAHIATASAEGSVRLWRAADGAPAETLTLPAPATAVAFSPDGSHLAAGVRPHGPPAAGDLTVWDLRARRAVAQLTVVNDRSGWIAFAPDGAHFAAATGLDHSVRIWDLAGREQAVLTEHQYGAAAVAFAPDGRIATGAANGEVRIWDERGERVLVRFVTEEESAEALAFSPDGELLAVAAGDNGGIWDAARGTQIAVLRGHRAPVNSIAFAGGGAVALTAGADATARLWDVRSGRAIAVFTLPTGFALDRSNSFAAAAASGDHFIAASGGRAARILAVGRHATENRGSLMRSACDGALGEGLSRLTAGELRAAPALDPALDRDVCRPAGLWMRLGVLLGVWRPRDDDAPRTPWRTASGAAAPTPGFARGPTAEERASAAAEVSRRDDAAMRAESERQANVCVGEDVAPDARIAACEALFRFTGGGVGFDTAMAYEALGHLQKGDFDEAIRTATVSFSYGEDPMAYWVRGIARYQKHEYEAAIEEFSQIIRLAPDNGVGYHGRAQARDALGQGGAALADYDEAARLDPDNAQYLNAACWAHVIANQAIDRALVQCDAAIALEPRANIYDSRGFLHLRRRDYPAAQADFEAALRADANLHASRYGRGLARLALGEAEAGQRDIDEASEADPQSIAALRQAGFAP